jgi:SagB-type dehydrogenase family enzyme
MKRTTSLLRLLLILIGFSLVTAAQDLKPVPLPPPQTSGGRPLMEVLRDRKSTREFGPAKLSPHTLSNLLWAAFGINRPDGRRTAPSAMNMQEITIYVVTADGAYTYDAKANALDPVLTGDFRAATGTQAYPKDAAVDLIYVADTTKAGANPSPDAAMYNAADTGFIAENVYLYCASEGLAVVVRASIDKPAVAKLLKLQPTQTIILAQSLGYPKESAPPAAHP